RWLIVSNVTDLQSAAQPLGAAPPSEALQLAVLARQAAPELGQASTEQKNAALHLLAGLLREHQDAVLAANAADLTANTDLPHAVRKRLELTPAKIEAMAA